MWPDAARPWYGSFVHSQAESLRALKIELDVVYIPGHVSKIEYLRGVREMHRRLSKARYDLVHAHYGYSGVVARLQRRVPLVISYCGDDLLGTPDANGRMTASSRALAHGFAQLARYAHATITKSAAMERRLPRCCRTSNHVIPNGVDLERLAPMERADARGLLGWGSEHANVLFVGNPAIPRKNIRLARAVCERLVSQGCTVELRIAWGIAPDEVRVWMSASDALLVPSLSEGSPNTVKEAMALELPIVSAPVGDAPELLAGVDGTFLVERDVENMTSALRAALEVGRAPAARTAIERLSIERVAERIAQLYSEVIGTASARRPETASLERL